MVDPFAALTVASLGLTLVYIIFRPGRGYFWQWRRAMQNTQRVLMEDALKQIYHCEYQHIPCTLAGISGALSISSDQTARLLTRLETQMLVRSQGNTIELTDEGRAYALRIIRVHRLWEKYLADQTGIPEREWHSQAERQEHRMSPGEANALAARMGNPQFDPHGDPIPSAAGEIAPPKGVPLTDLAKGEFAEIIHIEDEPEAIYAQLVAQNLHPGMIIQTLDISPERIHFAAGEEEFSLAPLFAANVSVYPLMPAEMEAGESAGKPLSQLADGESATVVGISKACRGMQRRRLMDLGIIPGTTILVEMRSASGDPTAYNIRGATIALRKSQSDLIFVDKK